MACRANEVLPRCSEQKRGDRNRSRPGDRRALWQAVCSIDFSKAFIYSFLMKIKFLLISGHIYEGGSDEKLLGSETHSFHDVHDQERISEIVHHRMRFEKKERKMRR